MTLTKRNCEQYQIELPGESFTRITICESGDLFIDGDWGYYCYSWRAFGKSFKEFLSDLGPDYLIVKFESHQLENGGKKSINARAKQAITAHFKAFQEILKSELL
jgi:hypothetical protein